MSLDKVFWAGQEVYIDHIFLPIIMVFLLLVPLLLAFFAFGFWRHYQLWRLGKPGIRFDLLWPRLKTTLLVAFAHTRNLQEIYPGLMHLLIFGGSILLILGKIIRLFSFPVGLTNPPQRIFLYASLASEIGGIAIIVGGGMAIYRRYMAKPSRLDTKPDDTLVLLWGLILVLTGYLAKGYRIASSEVGAPSDWALWAPISFPLSQLLVTFLQEVKNELLVWHRALIHAIPAFLFLVYILANRSRMQHILLSAVNVFFRPLEPRGALVSINFETAKTYGANKIKDFTQKQLMDLDACTRCGRCQDNCPAYLSGKVLSPKKVIQNLKTHMMEFSPSVFARWSSIPPDNEASTRTLLGGVVSSEELWDCTTCSACEEQCPVYVGQVDKNIEMRRNQVLTNQRLVETVQATLRNMEIRGNPWRGTEFTRDAWTKGLEIKGLSQNTQADWLYWVGCTGALVERNMNVTVSLAKVLKIARIDFAILGEEEGCCGDPARRMGHELQFQIMAQQNIEIMKRYGVKKVVTACPHCLEVLKNEYPQFGGEFEVFHHTELLGRLIREQKITFSKAIDKVLTYHDPCYLGRYNGIYEAPRKILKTIPRLRTVEMEHCRRKSFCCGGGGGHSWMEEPVGRRINQMRVEQAISTQAQMIGLACPFCLQMVEDALTGLESPVQAKDVAELVAEAI